MARLREGARAPIRTADVEAWLERLWIAAEGASLRREERRKAELLRGLLDEVAQACARVARSRDLVLVDAAAGKAYAGLLAAQLVIAPAGRRPPGRAIAPERHPRGACPPPPPPPHIFFFNDTATTEMYTF